MRPLFQPMETTVLQIIQTTVFTLCLLTLAATNVPAVDQSATTQPTKSPTLTISGTGLESTHIGLDRLATLPRTSLKVKEKEGEEFTYEGVKVADILAVAGMKFGQSLRGERLADYLLADSAEGFRVVFALTELDADFSDRVVLLADRRNGQAIDGRDGPLRIVVSDERKHARWVRNVTALTVRSAPKPN